MKRPSFGLRDKFAVWLVSRLPDVVIQEPERVVWATAKFLIGVSGLIGIFQPTSIQETLPRLAIFSWALSFMIAGMSLLLGMFAKSRILERLGLALTVLATITFTWSSISFYGFGRNTIMVIIFTLLALSAIIRLVVSTASQVIISGIVRESTREEDYNA